MRSSGTACSEAGLPVDLTTDVPLPFPVSKAIRLRDQAAIHPRLYCLGLARAIHGKMGRVYERTRALNVEEKVRVCRVKTDRGTLSAPIVVVATHLPFMGDGRFYAKTAPTRSYAMAFRDAGDITDGMLISTETPVRSLRPAIAGAGWLVVGGEGHKVGHEDATEERYAALETWGRERLGLSRPDHRWSAQDYVSVDGMPYVGRLSPDHERVFVATAFRKWGMTNGTAAAMMIADAVAGRENPWSFAFDATRTRPRQAAKRFITEGIDVAKHLVLDKVLPVNGHGPDDLAPGSAAIMKIDGETLAVHRDERGRLLAVSPDCTHMGCRVAWNSAERTWDCPCHGSRFAPDGTVIQGPANEPLERKRIPAGSRR